MNLVFDWDKPSGLSSAGAAEGFVDSFGVSVPWSAPAILSLSLDLSSPPPQAVSSRAAEAASAAATGKERRFTVDSPCDRSAVEVTDGICMLPGFARANYYRN
jgi:hypothetical protein